MKMLLTGDPINAKYAKEIGLINDHYPISELEDEVLKLAKKIASKSNLTIKIGKKAFYKQLEIPLRKAYQYTSEVMTKKCHGTRCRRRNFSISGKEKTKLEK